MVPTAFPIVKTQCLKEDVGMWKSTNELGATNLESRVGVSVPCLNIPTQITIV